MRDAFMFLAALGVIICMGILAEEWDKAHSKEFMPHVPVSIIKTR